MIAKFVRGGIILAALIALPSLALADETLDKIKSTGKLTVGVKVDYKPFGFRDESGAAIGFEHDLIAEIAKQLGKKIGHPITIEKVTVTAQNRIPFLQQGKIDLIAATMNESEERRKQMDIIDPGYYASGATILARKSQHIKRWEDLTNKAACAQQGAFYNKPLAEKYNIKLMPYAGVAEMNQALLDDRCIAEINDSVLVSIQLQDSKWADYESNVDPQFLTPFVMAVRKGSDDTQKAIGDILKSLHKSGKVLELAKKWKLPTPWLKDMQTKS